MGGIRAEVRWIMILKPGMAKFPEWMRSACMNKDGVVFAPAAIVAGNELKAMLCASWDGVSTVLDDGHVYLPVEWLATYCPDIRRSGESGD